MSENVEGPVITDIDRQAVTDTVLTKYDVAQDAPNRDALAWKLRALYIPDLIKSYGSLSAVKGKRILDIGCGSLDYDHKDRDPSLKRMFEPWFCRLVTELGAEAVGIDIGDLEGEEFTHYQRDIRNPDVLSDFADHSFDGIHMRSVIGVRDLNLGFKRELELQTKIQEETKRVLKDDGKVIFFSTVVEPPE
jgi:SAM-dependent methyltransferase